MKTIITVPSFGESITSASVARWLVEEGVDVKQGDPIVTLETDKVSADVEASIDGVLHHIANEGDEIKIGGNLGFISPEKESQTKQKEEEIIIISEKPSSPLDIPNIEEKATEGARFIRQPMSKLRQTIAKRLVEAQHEAAILSTFNECDMSAIIQIRKQFNDKYRETYGTKLGFMSFFIKAVVKALQEVPAINSKIDGNDLIQNLYYDISIAIGTEKGLITPVIRDADKKSPIELEKELADLADKARSGKISISDLTGGCFTISNGGTYGSLLSTPILNPPQSGILGMHTIQERPVARNGEIVIRPMMYLALSYDHRIVDGKQAVEFLLTVKNAIENPIFEL